MLFKVFFLTLAASVFAAAFRIRDLVVSHGLQTAAFEDHIAVVVGDAVQDDQGQTRYPVVFWMGLGHGNGPFSARKTIKPANLMHFDTNMNFRPESDFDRTNEVQVARLKECGELIFGLGPMESLLDKGMTECKARLIGGAVYMAAGHFGMVYVAELRRRYIRYLEHAWNHVGRFRA